MFTAKTRKALHSKESRLLKFHKITTKDKKTVPLRLNNVQQDLFFRVKKLKKQNIPVRIVIVKPRQVGVTTFFGNYNLDRVTISSGPNSILFGTGSPAGALDVTLARPLLKEDIAKVRLQVDSWDGWRPAWISPSRSRSIPGMSSPVNSRCRAWMPTTSHVRTPA